MDNQSHGRRFAQLSLPGDTVVRGYFSGSHPNGIAGLIEGWPPEWPAPTTVNDLSRIPSVIRPVAPKNAGMDRILKAVACNVIRPPQRPALVIDTGTATCVDAISADGDISKAAPFCRGLNCAPGPPSIYRAASLYLGR